MDDNPEPPPRAASGRARTAALAGLLFAATAALYWPACDNEFVFDDFQYVVQNPQVLGGLSDDGVLWAVETNHASNWHPLTWWSLQLDAEAFGPGPRGFHRTNVLLHAANVALLLLALHALTGAVWRAAAVAALFAAHPLHVESVAWVAERKDVLCGLFFVFSLILYVRYVARPSPGRMGAVAAALGLGLMAKPMLVTVPCVLLLLDVWPLRRLPVPGRGAGGWWRTARPLVAEKWPLFACALAASWLTVGAQSNTALIELEIISMRVRLANAVASYGAYLAQTVYPADLAVLYPHSHEQFSVATVAGGAAALAALTGLAVWAVRRRPYLFVGWLWFVGMMVPAIGLVQVGHQARADRYTYLPHIGLFVAAVWGVADLVPRRRGWRVAVGCAAATAVIGCALVTRSQIGVWKDPRTLWEHALAVTTDNYFAEMVLADLDQTAGDRASAAARFERAARINSGDPTVRVRLAELLVELQRPEDAITHYRVAVAVAPRELKWRLRLAALLLGAGRPDEAEEEYRQARGLEEGGISGTLGLGRVAVRRGQSAEAAVLFARVWGGDPADPAAVSDLGRALADRGLHEEAAAMYGRAIRLRPADATAHLGRGDMLAVMGKWSEAEAAFSEVIRLAPSLVSAAFARAHARARVGRGAEAEADYAAALRLAPDWPEQTARSAWQTATGSDAKSRPKALVVLQAERASDARGGRSADALDALAAAYADAGRWADAVATAEKAVAAATAGNRLDLAAQIRKRRDLYADRKPFRSKSGGG